MPDIDSKGKPEPATYEDPDTIRDTSFTDGLYTVIDKEQIGIANHQAPPTKPVNHQAPKPPTEPVSYRPPPPEPATYQDPATIQHETAPTGDLYAVVDKPQVGANNHASPIEPATYQDPSIEPPEPATYQDPATIQRETAPTGDLWSHAV